MRLSLPAVLTASLLAVFLLAALDKAGYLRERPKPVAAVAPAPVAAPLPVRQAPPPERTDAATLIETPEVLPAGAGREETFYACTACHGTRIMTQQGLSRERWDATIDWMVERHRMAPPDPADRTVIVDYLAAAFPPKQRRGYSNPFLN